MSQYNPYGDGQSGRGMQGPEIQGQGGFSYGSPQAGAIPQSRGGVSALTIVLIVLGIFFLAAIVCVGLLAALLMPAVGAAREAARQMADSNNMKMVGLAMHNYADVYRCLPPSYAINSNEEKVWSWKVSLLPYIEKNSLYSEIDFQNMRRWDDPYNVVLQGPAPPAFRSIRAADSSTSANSNVFLISSPTKSETNNTVFIDGEVTRFQDCVDGTSNTIVAIMLAKHGSPWASPENLTPDEAYNLMKNEDRVFVALFLDGSVRRMTVDIDREAFMAMLTRDGGEVVFPDEFQP